MFEQYALIMHKALDVIIMIPDQWPARAEPILMTLAEKIVERFNDLSPIVRVNNMPTRLIRGDSLAGFYYVFSKVAEKEISGAYIYDVIVPDNEENIRLEITSGTVVNGALWSPPPERSWSPVEKIYNYFSSLKLQRNISSMQSNKGTSSRQVHRGARKRKNCHVKKYQRSTGKLMENNES